MAKRYRTFSSAAAGLAVAAIAAAAGCTPAPRAPSVWDIGERQGAWRARQITGAPVYGTGGAALGEVADLVVGPDDRMAAIIVEGGGVGAAGDVRLRVPWDQVDLTPGVPGVRVPIDRTNVAEFSSPGDEAEGRPRAWRAGELIGNAVRFAGGGDRGIVADLVFSRAGELEAVVVSPDVGYGVGRTFVFPWPGYDVVDPGPDVLDMPYTWAETGELPPFDYDMHDDVF